MEKRNLRKKALVDDLRNSRKVSDLRFDEFYPLEIRKLSQTHWTPVAVALRATELMATNRKTRVLDVGSGCGKFCTVAALSGHGQFFGVEQRPHLVDIARKVAQELGATQASFIQGNMVDQDWSFYDAIYLFNPFYENVMESIRIDDTVSHSEENYRSYIRTVQTKLQDAQAGTKLLTYHGFGGEMPLGYLRVRKEPIGTSYLEVWVKLDLPHDVDWKLR